MLKLKRLNRHEQSSLTLLTLSRGITGFFEFTTLLGVLWFADAPGGQAFIIPALLMGFSSLVVAFISQGKLSSSTTRRTLVTLCVVGAGAGLVLVADDLGATSGIEWDVVAIRLVHIAALAAMAVIGLRRPPEST